MKLLAATALALLGLAAPAAAATLEPVGEFDQPTFVTSDPADADRLLVAEREGRVVEARDGAASELADLTALVSCCASERGLASIAPAPDFHASGRFYAIYTGTPAAGGAEGDIHLDAFRREGVDLIRERVLTVEHAAEDNHNGDLVEFGPDGYLYVSIGDGGGGGDPFESGQDLETLLGKLLRIEPRPGQEPPYAIPLGNPFAAGPGLDEIWAYGLRNPWRFSFDRQSGDLTIADVGQGVREEVDFAPSPAPGAVGGAGANYGWSCREGLIAFSGAPPGCPAGGFADPVFDYPHPDPEDGSAHGCAITGGYVVRDPTLGGLLGRYVYADYCVGQIRSLVLPGDAGGVATGDRSEGLAVANPVSFGEDACGRLYVVAQSATVHRLVGAAPADCALLEPPDPDPEPEPDPAPGATEAGASAPSATVGRRATRVRLRRVLLRGRPHRALLIARAVPCATSAGLPVRLKRGGRPLRRKRLNRGCAARFRVPRRGRSTYRALVPVGPERAIRSPAVAVPPPLRRVAHRSHVRTIALAKPRP